MNAAAAGVEAFRRTLDAGDVADVAAAPAGETVEQLQARFLSLQTRAAAGGRGAVEARRQMTIVRHELMRRGVK